MAKIASKRTKVTAIVPQASTSKLPTDTKAVDEKTVQDDSEAESDDEEQSAHEDGSASGEDDQVAGSADEELVDEAEEAATTFASLGVIEPLCQACEQLGFKKPTDIQSQSIPYAIQDRDIIGLAQTGSGKTAAFALPILQALWENPQPLFACVLAPTRYLLLLLIVISCC